MGRNVLIIPMRLTMMILVLATFGQGFFLDISYEDLTDLNVNCSEYHTCKMERFSDNNRYNCICGEICSQYDTCCFDSEFRDKQKVERKSFNCISRYGPYNSYYFMVDSCDPTWIGDNSTEELCKGDPEKLNNLFLALPVTNPKTRVTYRNHFCAVCNDDTDEEQLLFWDMWLGSDLKEFNDVFLPDVHFYPNRAKWVFTRQNKRKGSVFVTIKPKEEWDFVYACLPNVISECAEGWNDTSVKEKCDAYMAVIFMHPNTERMKTYRNPHCAICNYQNLDDHECTYFPRPWGFDFPFHGIFRKPLSIFSKTNKCDDSMFYDTATKECKIVSKGE